MWWVSFRCWIMRLWGVSWGILIVIVVQIDCLGDIKKLFKSHQESRQKEKTKS